MEKSEVVRCYNEGKHYIKTCLEQIASLEQNNDKELRLALKGTYMVEVSYKAAENFIKVCKYIIDGEDGAQKLKGKLLDLKGEVRQLYESANKHNLITIKEISDCILREIGEVEEWTNDDESNGIQESTPPETISGTGDEDCDGDDDLLIGVSDDILQKFGNRHTYKTFVKQNKASNSDTVAKEYMKIVKQNKIKIVDGDWTKIIKHFQKIGLITITYSPFLKHIRKYTNTNNKPITKFK